MTSSFAVDEWRAKWHLNMRFDDATPEELIRDMGDIHPHVRIKAISTCARAALYKPPPLEGRSSGVASYTNVVYTST